MCASLGNEARKLVKRNPEDPTVACFLTESATAYKNCAVYANEKLSLLNSTLKAFAALGPCMILSKKDLVMKYLIELPDLVSVLTEEETKLYKIQVGIYLLQLMRMVMLVLSSGTAIYQRSILLSTKWPCPYCPSSTDPK